MTGCPDGSFPREEEAERQLRDRREGRDGGSKKNHFKTISYFAVSGIFPIFAVPICRETYSAVVVKWYTRYFEGVVGISPCEFDSHLPHEKQL